MEYIREKFDAIHDTRNQSYIEHPLVDVLIIIMCSILCGLDELADIVVYSRDKSEFFRTYFGIEKIPSKPTFSRILNMIDGDAVAKVIIEIMTESASLLGDIIAVDGKAIRQTGEKGRPHSALQILTAYLTESGVVLGQASIHEKTNEIPVFKEMLDYLNVKGKTITADAMHCQRGTCAKIIEKGGNYVFGLKENQKSLFDDAALFFRDEINSDSIQHHETFEKRGGRAERRIIRKATDISWLDARSEWSGLTSVFEVRRIITEKGKTTDQTSYYITSLNASAEKLLWATREHWKIESLHWLLDVVFSEDECLILSENGQKTLNILRKLALLIHKRYIAKQTKKCSVKASLLKCLISEERVLDVIGSL